MAVSARTPHAASRQTGPASRHDCRPDSRDDSEITSPESFEVSKAASIYKEQSGAEYSFRIAPWFRCTFAHATVGDRRERVARTSALRSLRHPRFRKRVQ